MSFEKIICKMSIYFKTTEKRYWYVGTGYTHAGYDITYGEVTLEYHTEDTMV